MGPLFGAVLARALDAWWDDLGHPDPFVVVEAGAGTGTLARDVLAAGPACSPTLRYVLVERSDALRERQAARLPLELSSLVLGPTGTGDDDDDEAAQGSGPLATSLAGFPGQPFTGVVLANELLDNLPFRLVERQGDAWAEVRVGWGAGGAEEVLVPAAPDLEAEAHRLAPAAPDGGRVPLQHEAARWLRGAVSALERGRIVVVDYADASASLAARPWLDWVRTYRGHSRGGHPLDDPGSQDITCEVAVDQLGRSRAPDSDRSQTEFLTAHGIEELVAAARAGWEAGARRGDLAALRHKSRIGEASALLDPTGLGGFRVLEWSVG
ncbi:MAG: SAM-dependent methyltransferase [Acidimicrobiales bacterium]